MTQPVINETSIFELDPSLITVHSDLPRQRKELGEIQKLVESIKTFGQIQPVVINRNNELIAGGRRLAACMLGGFNVRVCYKDTVDPILMRELELEENLQRKDLTPAEECLAIDELVTLKQKIHGKPTQGREGGYTLTDAADLIGKTKGNIIEAIQIAGAVKMFPELGGLKTKSDIKKAVKGYERVAEQMTVLTKYEETIKKTDEFILVNRDAVEYMKGLGAATIDLVFTDPPYGIDIHDLAITLGGETGGAVTTTGTSYDDSEKNAKLLLEILATESYRITKDTAHCYVFCAPSHFWWLRERMGAAGWLVSPRPFIWIKRETGQNNQPEKWFSSAYEFVLFARKPCSHLVLEGRPDWIQCDPVLPSERVHQAEKPVILCKELISRTCMAGQYMLDPFAGSGAIVEAGFHMKLLSLGCEKDVVSYASMVARMRKVKEGK